MSELPFSQAAENNRQPILERLQGLLRNCRSVLEVGSGTGQHAVYFAEHMPHLHWQPTEHPQALGNLRPRLQAMTLGNLAPARGLDIAHSPWDVLAADAIYTANTLHIISRELVEAFFAGCAEVSGPETLLLVYGPFNYDGRFTSESNARFEEWLKARDSRSGIRDFEWVDALAQARGYELMEDRAMPANNRLLCWQKGA